MFDNFKDFSINSINLSKERLRLLFCSQSVLKGDFILSSGQKSDYYIDARLTTLSAEPINLISHIFTDILVNKIKDVEAVACPPLGACPLVVGVSMLSYHVGYNIKGLFVRKEIKTHGTQKLIEGPFVAKGGKIVILEDVITTGASALNCLKTLRQAGFIVENIICLLARDINNINKLEKENDLKIHTIYTNDDVF